jgi:hypothetical protein
MTVLSKLRTYFAAGQAGLVLTSVEPEECLREFAEAARSSQGTDEPWELYFWDPADGLTDTLGNRVSPTASEDEDMAALGLSGGKPPKMGLHETLEAVLETIRGRQYREAADEATAEDASLRVLVVRNFDRHLMPSGPQGPLDPFLLNLSQKIINEGQSTNVFLVLQTTPEFELPTELTVHCEYITHELPSSDERVQIISELIPDLDLITPAVLNATAGLSRAKTAQYVAETMATHGTVNPMAVFQKKANHLARSSKLDVWSPEFVQQVKLWPMPEVVDLAEATDVTMVAEETHATNRQLAPGETRNRIRYVDAQGKPVERWLDTMPVADFEKLYRPERDFYSFKSVVGLSGLKQFLKNGLRPNVPDRARMKHVLMLGVPGTGKSFTMQCTSGEFRTPLSSMQASNLYSKWLGDTDKILARMLATVEMIGGILAIDEFQRFLPQGGSGGESGGVENRLMGTLLTWFNNQNSNLVLSAANNISNLPDEITRSGRVDALMFVGFPGRQAKDAAWNMYIRRHELSAQELPTDNYWTPADIMSCCRLAELQQVSLKEAARWITPSYEKNPKQMDELMRWAEGAGCICAETGERYKHPKSHNPAAAGSETRKVTRKVRTRAEGVDG